MAIESIMLQGKHIILKKEKTMTCGTLQRWYQRQAEACKFEYIFYNMEQKQVLLCSILKDVCMGSWTYSPPDTYEDPSHL